MGSTIGRRKALIQSIWEFARRLVAYSRGSIWLTILIAVAAGLLEVFGILLVIPFLELQGVAQAADGWRGYVLTWLSDLGINGYGAQVLALLFILLLVAVIRAVLVWLRTQRTTRLAIGFANEQRSELYRAVAQADWLRLLNHSKVGLEHSLVEDSLRVEIAAQSLVFGIVTGIAVIAQIAIAFWLSPLLALLVLAIFAIAVLVLRPFLTSAQRLGTDTTDINRDMFEVLGQFMDGLKAARVAAGQLGFLQRFQNGLHAQEALALRTAGLQTGFSLAFQLMTLGAVCLVFVCAIFVLNLPFAILAAFLLLLMRLSGPVQNLLSQLQVLATELPAMTLIDERIADLSQSPVALPNSEEPVLKTPKILVRDLGFAYRADRSVLNGQSFDIPAGQTVAIQGPSGVGKTTLLDLLSGLLSPNSGKVLVAGQSPKEAFWSGRYRLEYLLQTPVLFELTVREMLTRDLSDIQENQIWQALGRAQLATRFKEFPEGLNTRISARSLSGGEAQRLAFARLFLRPADVIFLDEATNAMDSELEDQMLSELRAMPNKPTIIVINHSDQNPSWADQVIDLAAK